MLEIIEHIVALTLTHSIQLLIAIIQIAIVLFIPALVFAAIFFTYRFIKRKTTSTPASRISDEQKPALKTFKTFSLYADRLKRSKTL